MEFWQEQREGSPLKYYLLYTIAWGLLTGFLVFFGFMILGQISLIPLAADNNKVYIIVALGFVCGFLITWITRTRNEKRYRKLLDKSGKNN
ncbi:MAG: hypothetical protein C5B52_11520 [Bacteroidetes bacterium]|nr:MAG: hypothetical protein C5B52_11520 [Bacteroidota bacterium]